jgi:cation diffusion facilitator family transporter
MMVAEIVGGILFRSMALVADGLHMSTHAAALLIAALAYTFARRRAHDARFTFGTGKFGDLAGFTSAIVLAMIALLIGWESVGRLLHPVSIAFDEAIPIAVLGLGVNLVSALRPCGDCPGAVRLTGLQCLNRWREGRGS